MLDLFCDYYDFFNSFFKSNYDKIDSAQSDDFFKTIFSL